MIVPVTGKNIRKLLNWEGDPVPFAKLVDISIAAIVNIKILPKTWKQYTNCVWNATKYLETFTNLKALSTNKLWYC